MIILPSFQTASSNFRYTIELESQIVTIELMWNVRSGYWFLTVTDGNENTVDGIKCVVKFPLLLPHKAFTDLRGDFFFLKIAPGEDILTYDNINTIWQFQYYSPNELAEWRAENGF